MGLYNKKKPANTIYALVAVKKIKPYAYKCCSGRIMHVLLR